MSVSRYDHRLDFVLRYVRDRHVLDVGSAELVGTVNRHKLERWPHRVISEVAASVLGIEKDERQVEALRELGYDLIQADAESFDLGRTFDVVFAGELIEHLSNAGLFLESARRHLQSDGVLLITTPNRYSIRALRWPVLRNRVESYEKGVDGHVCYYDLASIAELLTREGYRIREVGYYVWVGERSRRSSRRWLYRFLQRRRPHLLPGIVVAAAPG